VHKGWRHGKQRYGCDVCGVRGYADTFVANALAHKVVRVTVSREQREAEVQARLAARLEKIDAVALERRMVACDCIPLPEHLEPACVSGGHRNCLKCVYRVTCHENDGAGLPVLCERTASIFVGATMQRIEL
jgi:stage V sporulation protein SpoVS